ncbi:hypothetical protein LINPERPRIM_LOCUS10096, partial [Linum perenne]
FHLLLWFFRRLCNLLHSPDLELLDDGSFPVNFFSHYFSLSSILSPSSRLQHDMNFHDPIS